LITRESPQDKEFHFQNWFRARLSETGFNFEAGGRNSYPDFRLVASTDGFEVKGLAYPGREANYDCNSQVPSGNHNGRTIYYVFGRYAARLELGMSRMLELLGLEVYEVGALNQAAEGLEGKNLAPGGEEHFLHVFRPHAEAAASDAGDDLVLLLAGWRSLQAHLSQMLDTRHFVAGGAVVLSDFGFNDNPGIKLIRDDKVGRLVETWDPLSSLGLSIADAGFRKDILDGRFKTVSDQPTDRISVAGEGASKKALIQQHGIWGTHGSQGFDSVKAASRVGFLKPVEGDAVWSW
jgi:hypothetical protein